MASKNGIVLVNNRPLEAIISLKMPLKGFWSLQKPLEAIGSHKKLLALFLKASNGFEELLMTSKGL